MTEYDVTVIGAGPGGYVAAIRAAQRGASVALVEREHLGGTCLNWGCIPTKALLSSADVLHTVQNAAAFGVRVDGNAKPDWPAMLARKDKLVEGLRQGVGALVKSNAITVVRGTAAFTGRHELAVRDDGGTSTAIRSPKIIIATGSDSVRPAFLPQSKNVLFSREALALSKLPREVLILGGGVIGCEFACLYARLGVTVILVEMLPRILPMVDADVARVVSATMERLGVTLLTGTRLEEAKAAGRKITAVAGDTKLSAAVMLACVGRRPYLDGLNLQATGLRVNDRGFHQRYCQTARVAPGAIDCCS